MKKIGFIGLGKMGWWMAKNLVEAGYLLVAYDLDEAALNKIINLGAEAGKSPQDVALKTDLILIVIPPPAVEETLCGENGILKGCSNGQIVANLGNSNPEDDILLAGKCAKYGVHFLDVGISGAPKGARDATLAMMVGGDRAIYDKVRDVLLTMGSVVDYFGPTGSGHLVKTVNNMLVIMNMVCASEVLNFSNRCGLDEKLVLRVLTKGLANSKILEHAKDYYDKDPMNRCTSQSMIKKLGKGNHINWAQDIAREKGIFLPLAALANEAFTCASEDKGYTQYDRNIEILKGIRWQAIVASAED